MDARKAKPPTQAQRDRLTKTYAKQLYAYRMNAPMVAQQKLYDEYKAALQAVLDRIGGVRLSHENQVSLEAAAERWLNSQGLKGAGVWW